MTEREALKLALEYVELVPDDRYNAEHIDREALATAIKEALAQPEQEPVGQLLENAFGRGQVMWFNKPKDESMLYTTPPQRTWVGLTDEEIKDCFKITPDQHLPWHIYQRIEAKLKEKNT